MNNQYIIDLFSGFTGSYNSDPNNSGNTLYFAYGNRMKVGDNAYYNQLFLPTSYETNIVYEGNGFKTYTYNIAPEFHIKLDNPESEITPDILSLMDNYQLNLENFFRANFNNKTFFNSLTTTDFQTMSPDICYSRLINVTLVRKENNNNIFNSSPTIIPFKNAILKNIESITQPSGNTSMQINISDGSFYDIELPSGGGSTGKTITNITQPSGDTSMSVNYTDNTFDIIDLPIGPSGLTGTSGVSISSVTQSSGITSAMTVTLSNGNTSNILLPKGDTGSQGQSGLSYNILSLVNNYEYIDHLIPAGASSNQTQFFQSVILSGAGSAGFLNQSGSWLGGAGIIRLSTGAATATDLGIRSTAGVSGHLINSNVSEYYFGFYSIALQNSTNTGLFRLCVQNGITATSAQGNRTGIYLDFDWQTDGVKPTFSVFNNTVSSSILLNYPLSTNTLYAVKFRVSNSICELYINNVLLHTFTTNLPVFAPIQQSVGLTKTAGTTGITYLVDVLGAKNLVNLNNYNF